MAFLYVGPDDGLPPNAQPGDVIVWTSGGSTYGHVGLARDVLPADYQFADDDEWDEEEDW